MGLVCVREGRELASPLSTLQGHKKPFVQQEEDLHQELNYVAPWSPPGL